MLAGNAAPGFAQAPPPAPASPAPQAPAPDATTAPANAPPASSPATNPAPPLAPPSQGFQPAPSPLLSPPTAPNASTPPAPLYPQPYSQPQPYYGPYAPAPGYPAAQPYPRPRRRGPEPGAHEHDGFFLRFNVGVGAGGARYKEQIREGQPVSKVKTRGVAGSLQVAIGGSVYQNLILHGNMSITGVSANKEVDGIEDSSYDELSSTMWLFGGGATYYFMPPNLYLTLVVGASALTERRNEEVLVDGRIEDRVTAYVDSGAGFGTTLTIGKEWWVGRRGEWGIGAALTGAFYAAPVEIVEVSSTFLAHSVSLSFSCTLN